HRKRSVRSCL
ncbi:jg10890, partial [Pararge aegeria aegeria]